ncbi:MAG: glycogen synthase [Candidatus Bipolaricaulota bacterium]
MRIVFVTTFPSPDTGGGMGRVAHELAAASARVHEVLLLCPGEDTSVGPSAPGQPTLVRVAASGAGDVLLPDLRGRRKLQSLLASFHPQIVHAHDFGPLALWLQDWARSAGCPFVVTLHCLPSQAQAFSSLEKPPLAKRIANSRLFDAFVDLFLRRCDGVIALNQAMADDLRRTGYRGPVYQVPNGRNLAPYHALPPADVTQPEKHLLFVGSFARRKNQRYLLEMMEHLAVPAWLTLVGEALEPGYLAELHDHQRRHGLDRVNFVGPVPYERIPSLLARAHVFVSASRLEVQSLAVIEALASATPVVGLANETIDEFVDDAVGARLPPEAHPSDFAHQVERICTLPPTQYEALCRAARERVRALDWQAVVEENRRVYEELATARTMGGRVRARMWTPWLVAASAVRYGFSDLAHPVAARRRRTRALPRRA